MTREDRADDCEDDTGRDQIDKVKAEERNALLYMELTEAGFLSGEHRDKEEDAEVREPRYALVLLNVGVIYGSALIAGLLRSLLHIVLYGSLLIIRLTVLLLRPLLTVLLIIRLLRGLLIRLLRLLRGLLISLFGLLRGLLGLLRLNRRGSAAVRAERRALGQLLTAIFTKCHDYTSFLISFGLSCDFIIEPPERYVNDTGQLY